MVIKKRFGAPIYAAVGVNTVLISVNRRRPVLVSFGGKLRKKAIKGVTRVHGIAYGYGVFIVETDEGIYVLDTNGDILLTVEQGMLNKMGLKIYDVLLNATRSELAILSTKQNPALYLLRRGNRIKEVPISFTPIGRPRSLLNIKGRWKLISTYAKPNQFSDSTIVISDVLNGERIEVDLSKLGSIALVYAPFNGKFAIVRLNTKEGKQRLVAVDVETGNIINYLNCEGGEIGTLLADPFNPFIVVTSRLLGINSVVKIKGFPLGTEYRIENFTALSICCGNVLLMSNKESDAVLSILRREEYRSKLGTLKISLFPLD